MIYEVCIWLALYFFIGTIFLKTCLTIYQLQPCVLKLCTAFYDAFDKIILLCKRLTYIFHAKISGSQHVTCFSCKKLPPCLSWSYPFVTSPNPLACFTSTTISSKAAGLLDFLIVFFLMPLKVKMNKTDSLNFRGLLMPLPIFFCSFTITTH